MSSFSKYLNDSLVAIQEQHLYRTLREIDSPQDIIVRYKQRSLVSFASNDYLGLANHPSVREAAKNAIDEFGGGSGASRLVTGSLAPHRRLEEQLAEFKDTEAALCFSSGYQTALGALTSILSKDDTVFSDRLNHACLIDGIRLSKAQVKIFEHNDTEHLRELLQEEQRQRTTKQSTKGNLLIVTESVFSMDGDQAPLAEIAALKEEFNTWLMVDEAHATGLYGKHRRGLAEQANVADRIDIHMGTLGKALGAAGGYICGSNALRELLINRARSFIFSTAPCPAAAAAASAALSIIRHSEGEMRLNRLWQRVAQLREGLDMSGTAMSPIIPHIIGDEAESLVVSQSLFDQGLLAPAIRFPSVPKSQARLRITLSANHSEEQVKQLLDAIHGRATESHPSSEPEREK